MKIDLVYYTIHNTHVQWLRVCAVCGAPFSIGRITNVKISFGATETDRARASEWAYGKNWHVQYNNGRDKDDTMRMARINLNGVKGMTAHSRVLCCYPIYPMNVFCTVSKFHNVHMCVGVVFLMLAQSKLNGAVCACVFALVFYIVRGGMWKMNGS